MSDEVANADWNKHLPNPLRKNQKVFLAKNQEDVLEGYVRIKHGKSVSVFNKNHFSNVSISQRIGN